MNTSQLEPICAIATAPGIGAITVIRVSGTSSIPICNKIFRGKNLEKVKGHTLHFGSIIDQEEVVDEVLVSVFRAPKSYTKEDSVEISCHGSPYIAERILKLLIQQGCRLALPGEFTQRAFLNGTLDLVQAEAVAELIEADSAAAHKLAMNQLKGGFSSLLGQLREELIHFASMVELELDFGEEEVEFADREDLKELIAKIKQVLVPLIASFDAGNVVKEGIPVAIIGPPNAGKSTLLNALLKEEKAIVTEIAGTTRDAIEDTLVLKGIKFRFIDTAGIRETIDQVESIGIQKSIETLQKAQIVLFLYTNLEERTFLDKTYSALAKDAKVLWVKNKSDLDATAVEVKDLLISSKTGQGLDSLESILVHEVQQNRQGDYVLTNVRHYSLLIKTLEALEDTFHGLENGITGDFLAQDIRLALHHLGELTGTITTDDLLKNIFGKFCIGK